MTGGRDVDKKHQIYPQNGGCPPFVTPKIFFKNRALSLVYPYGALTYTYTYKKLQEIHFQRGTGVPRFTHNKGYEDK